MSELPLPNTSSRRSGIKPPSSPTAMNSEWPTPPCNRVLVAGNERYIVRLVEVNLQRAGYTVITAYNGVEVLEKVRNEQPDRVIIQANLSEMNGFDVTRNLKEDVRTAGIPIALLLHKNPESDSSQDLNSGADLTLIIPFNPHALIPFIGCPPK